MAMSKDRVEFILDPTTLKFRATYSRKESCPTTVKDFSTIYELLETTLGIPCGNGSQIIKRGIRVKIVCRPSQFARFLIKRNELGFVNGFIELEAVLVPENKDSLPVVDVSSRPSGC